MDLLENKVNRTFPLLISIEKRENFLNGKACCESHALTQSKIFRNPTRNE